MKKKISTLLLALTLLFAAAPAIAAEGDCSVSFSPAAPVVTLGESFTLNAVITYEGSDYVRVRYQEWNGFPEGLETITHTGDAVPSPTGSVITSSVTFTPLQPGTFTVYYTVGLRRGYTSAGNMEPMYASVVVRVVEPKPEVSVPPLPAPDAAARILKFNELKPNLGAGKDSINLIAAAARRMEQDNLFNGVESATMHDGIEYANPLYLEEVLNFLNELLDGSTVLVMPDAEYFAAD